MTTRTTRHYRWKLLAVSVAIACHPAGTLAAPGALEFIETGDPASTAPGSQELYLEVSINESATGRLARFLVIGGSLYADAATLRELGLRWPDSDAAPGLVALDSIPGLQARYDASLQQLALEVPLEALSGERAHFGVVRADRPMVDPAMRKAGLLLNYDLYAQGDGRQQSLSGWNELRLFGVGPGIWSNSAITRISRASGRDDVHDTVRLDSSWQLDLPDRMVSVVVGDTYAGGLSWTRSTRIGGVRASSNFGLQPYRITTPLASFAGDAVLPSTVDLFINGIRQSSQQVQPGQFQIDSVPTITGAGQAQMVITDINGQSRVVSFALYNTSQLLQAGLTDWSIEAGLVRRDYALRSFSYADDPMGGATIRHGLSDRFTLEGHAEATHGLQMAGAGGAWLLGERGGVVDFSAAGSRYRSASGHQYAVGYQWSSPGFYVSAGTLRRSDGFADVASLEGSELPNRIDRIFAGFNRGRSQFGGGYVRQDQPSQPAARYASLSWSRQLERYGYLSLSFNRNLEQNDSDSAFLYWSMPLESRGSVSASARHDSGGGSLALEASQPVNTDIGGWGWRAQATAGQQAGAQAQIARLGQYGGWSAGFNHRRGEDGADNSSNYYAGANGSVLLMQKHVFAMRQVDDAFALVSTDGIPDVPVLRENRLVGYTDEHGMLLVNRLSAWQNNRLTIDPLQVPTDVRVDETNLLAVPEARGGVLVRFPMRRVLSIQATVFRGDGRPVAAGSQVWLDDADPNTQPAATVVGFDGALYLEDLAPDTRLTIRQNDGFCEASLPALPPRQSGFVELDGLVCR